MLSVPETPLKGHWRALGALGEDKPPDSSEGLGTGGHAPEAQVIISYFSHQIESTELFPVCFQAQPVRGRMAWSRICAQFALPAFFRLRGSCMQKSG